MKSSSKPVAQHYYKFLFCGILDVYNLCDFCHENLLHVFVLFLFMTVDIRSGQINHERGRDQVGLD
jgi:hypothetical protein